jgi:alpha-mannosidase
MIQDIQGMQVQALKVSEDGDGYILRLREIEGNSRKVEMKLLQQFSSIKQCDLLERTLDEVAACTNQISFNTSPYEIHSFYLKL